MATIAGLGPTLVICKTKIPHTDHQFSATSYLHNRNHFDACVKPQSNLKFIQLSKSACEEKKAQKFLLQLHVLIFSIRYYFRILKIMLNETIGQESFLGFFLNECSSLGEKC
ncbi:mast cell carboxypeptidase A [Platysternon megacephalum]|uniref:Mast cell carboxypeptidase A n=1 Tax=Platysternon megacephalum TaxID=55544 RepID=A0A4D9E8N3_9SAUR|nr:mast cell carboxypeptidase A [Platysternon megacephalum]